MELISHVKTSHKVVALTFDDGPDPRYTPEVLNILKEVSGHATFFMIGEHAEKHPEIVKDVAGGGHEIGNHTYSHAKLTDLDTVAGLTELKKAENIFLDLIGTKPVVMRPPFLAYNQEVVSICECLGYCTIGAGNLEAKDWDNPGTEHIITETRKTIQNGSILIFHDGLGNRSQTVEAVRTLVHELNEQGYRLITVSELLKLESK